MYACLCVCGLGASYEGREGRGQGVRARTADGPSEPPGRASLEVEGGFPPQPAALQNGAGTAICLAGALAGAAHARPTAGTVCSVPLHLRATVLPASRTTSTSPQGKVNSENWHDFRVVPVFLA